jgi:hypothetical protein
MASPACSEPHPAASPAQPHTGASPGLDVLRLGRSVPVLRAGRRPGPPEAQVKLAKYLGQFATYIRANAHLIPNYGERHRCGEAISSALAESAINQIVAKRMVKKQQMRPDPNGPDLETPAVTVALPTMK